MSLALLVAAFVQHDAAVVIAFVYHRRMEYLRRAAHQWRREPPKVTVDHDARTVYVTDGVVYGDVDLPPGTEDYTIGFRRCVLRLPEGHPYSRGRWA